MERSSGALLLLGGIAGAWGVGAAAFAAHGAADPRVAALVASAAQILMVHAAVLVGLAALAVRTPRLALLSGALIGLGALGFATGVHASAFTGPRALAAIAPWGGSALIAGWLSLAVGGVLALVRKRAPYRDADRAG